MTYASQAEYVSSGKAFVEKEMHPSSPCTGCSQKHSQFESTLDLAVQSALSQQFKGLESLTAISYKMPYQGYISQRAEKPTPCTCDCHHARFNSSARNKDFETSAKSYFQNEGKDLAAYLKKQGREMYDLMGIGYESLDDAVAGVKIQGDKAKLIGNFDFERKVQQMARHYGVSPQLARRYVLDHEHTHLWQKNIGIGYDDPRIAELDVENTLVEYYTKKSRESPSQSGIYSQLRNIALDRSSNVNRNYGSKSAVNYN